MNRHSILAIVGLLAIILAVVACDFRRTPAKKPIVWRTGTEHPERLLKNGITLEEAKWHLVPTREDKGIVPGPMDYWIRGYGKLSRENTKTLRENHQWTPMELDTASLDRPTSPSFATDFFVGGSFLESKDFLKKIGHGNDPEVRVILNPEEMILYFSIAYY